MGFFFVVQHSHVARCVMRISIKSILPIDRGGHCVGAFHTLIARSFSHAHDDDAAALIEIDGVPTFRAYTHI